MFIDMLLINHLKLLHKCYCASGTEVSASYPALQIFPKRMSKQKQHISTNYKLRAVALTLFFIWEELTIMIYNIHEKKRNKHKHQLVLVC